MNNDIISRSALIKALKSNCDVCNDKNTNWCENCCPHNDFEDLIDNAPTVEIPTELCKDCRFLKDCETCEEKLRPQGEWNYIQAGMCICPFCGAMPHKLYKNYCANCGAELKGGAE